MTMADKLIEQRRRLGLSQEQLAYRLDVTRQAVSKWESGSCVPELSKLTALSDLYGVSLDYLVKDGIEEPEAFRQIPDGSKTGYFYTSKKKIMGIPLVCVRLSAFAGRGTPIAAGIIAIGNVAVGVIALGGVGIGVVGIGVVGLGLIAIGLSAMGGAALGFVALGIAAVGFVATGFYAFGMVAAGVRSIGKIVNAAWATARQI